MSISCTKSISFISLMALRKISTLYIALTTNKFNDWDIPVHVIHMKHRGLLNNHFCKIVFQISQMRQKQEKVKHIVTCFTKALLHVFKFICTYMFRFLHVFDNNILTKLYPFLLCQKIGRSFCLLSGRDIVPRVMHILSWKSFTLSRRFVKGKFSVT